MIGLTPIDELRDVRRRLATEAGLDVERYAKMLAETATNTPGTYVARPVVPQTVITPPAPNRGPPHRTDAPPSCE